MPDEYYTHQYSGEEIDAAVGRAAAGGALDKRIATFVNPNLLINGDFRAGCLVDQRKGRIVKPNTTYYSDKALTTAAGTTSAYVTAYRYATGTENGIAYASFKLTDTDAAPTYYAAQANVVRGYAGAGYGVDMFRHENTACVSLIEDDGVTLIHSATGTTVFYWCFPAPTSGQYTASLLYFKSDGTLDLLSRTFTATKGAFLDIQDAIPGTEDYVFSPQIAPEDWAAGRGKLRISNISATASWQQIKVVAAKWEPGDQQTLAHQDSAGNWVRNEVPSYADTLAKCQRYYQVHPKYYWLAKNDDGAYRLTIPIPVMRTIPTATYDAGGTGSVVADTQFWSTNSIQFYATGVTTRSAVFNIRLSAEL